MSNPADIAKELAAAVQAAASSGEPLSIRGAGTKRFCTGDIPGTPLDVTRHRGIVSYEPTELVITARAGTPLGEIEAVLAERNQMLGFEPPHFGPGATLGGTLACGFSGPRRPYAGSARDFVLGTEVVNGRGEILKFGGQVMKNVAGYDVSRLLVGSFGTLGVILEASLKVLPRPSREITLGFEMPAARAIETMNTWAGRPLPLSAAAHSGDTLYIRLSGTDSAVRAAHLRLGGDVLDRGSTLWMELREQSHHFFRNSEPLWRLSGPPATPPMDLPGTWLIDWGGAQRWLVSASEPGTIQSTAATCGGHAAVFGSATRANHLPLALGALISAVRSAMDPDRLLNSSL
jgi:glycolate oxidase FAD binding subunit